MLKILRIVNIVIAREKNNNEMMIEDFDTAAESLNAAFAAKLHSELQRHSSIIHNVTIEKLKKRICERHQTSRSHSEPPPNPT